MAKKSSGGGKYATHNAPSSNNNDYSGKQNRSKGESNKPGGGYKKGN